MRVLGSLLIFFSFTVSATVRSGSFIIAPKKGIEVISSQAPNYQTLLFTQEKKTQIGIYKKFEPQSINSVRIRAHEDGVAANSVKFLKSKQGSVFYYKMKDGIKFFSTDGGVLVLLTQAAEIIQPTQISLFSKNKKTSKGKAM